MYTICYGRQHICGCLGETKNLIVVADHHRQPLVNVLCLCMMMISDVQIYMNILGPWFHRIIITINWFFICLKQQKYHLIIIFFFKLANFNWHVTISSMANDQLINSNSFLIYFVFENSHTTDSLFIHGRHWLTLSHHWIFEKVFCF